MKIIIFETLFISYLEIKLNENFEVCFNLVLRSKKALKLFEINFGYQSLVVNFMGANRQIAFLELSLVYD